MVQALLLHTAMSLAVLDKLVWGRGFEFTTFILRAARHTATYTFIQERETLTSRGTSCKQPLNYNGQ